MIMVAIYCRLSEEDKNKQNEFDDSESISNQKSMLVSYAMQKEWGIYRIYSDENYSGIDPDRPEFNQMLADAKASRFSIILCKSQSRFTRDMEIVERYIHHQFVEWGIRFIGLVDNVDTDLKGTKKARQINGLVNEWYLEDISDSIKSVLQDKQKKGKYIGSWALYGYRKDPADRNHLIIDPDTRPVVELIFKMYLQGNTTLQIARYLNNEEVLSPTRYKQSLGEQFPVHTRTGLWSRDTILKMLKNQMYIGNMTQGYQHTKSYKSKKTSNLPRAERIIVNNTHEPIITRDVFDEVQKLISERRRSTHATGSPHLFAGKLKCLDCGNPLYKKTYSNISDRAYFRCKLSAIVDRQCTPHSIQYGKLIDIVSDRLREYMRCYCDLDSLIDNIEANGEAASQKDRLSRQIEKLKRDIKAKDLVVKNLYIDKVSGILSADQFVIISKDVNKEQDVIHQQIIRLENDLVKLSDDNYIVDRKKALADKYRDFESLDHQMIREFIDSIEIGERGPEAHEQIVKINWLF